MNGKDEAVTWPSALVASMLVLLVGSIAVAAILRYSVDEAMKIWGALGTVVGIFTGAFVTYFFTRAARKDAKEERKRADESLGAMVEAVGQLDPVVWQRVRQDPAVMRALAR